MSKLFEAISNLEADTGQGVIDSPFRTGHSGAASEPGSDNKPKKTLALAAGILILALSGGSGVLYISKKVAVLENPVRSVALSKGSLLRQDGQKEMHLSVKENAPVLDHEPGKETGKHAGGLNGETVRLKRPPEEIKGKGAASASFKPAESDKQNRAHFRPEKPLPTRRKLSKKTIAFGLPASNPLVLDSHQKRLLYRAERLRKNGDQAEALAIYKRIWQQTKNPMVANNLAAILMEKGRFGEAQKVLEQAVRISPKDQDLQYNLSQLQQFLKRQQTGAR